MHPHTSPRSAPSSAQLLKPRLTLAEWPTKRRRDAYLVEFVAQSELRDVLQRFGDPIRAASQVAASQRGVIDAVQLQGLGISRTAIARRRQQGTLHPLFRGTYLWGGPVPPAGAFETAAILACRRRVVLGYESTLALWALVPPPREVTVLRLGGRNRDRPGLIVRPKVGLRPGDLTTRFGLPTATPLRAMLDLAADGHPHLERIISTAHASGVVTAATLASYAAGCDGLAGAPLLRKMAGLEQRGFTRSQNERRMRSLCREARLPQPTTNARFGPWEADFYWADAGLVVEVDAINTHSDVAAFERDRRKQRALVAAGLVVLRFTDTMLHGEALPVAVDLAQAIARGTPRTAATR